MTDLVLDEELKAVEVLYECARRYLDADIKRCEEGMRFYENLIKYRQGEAIASPEA